MRHFAHAHALQILLGLCIPSVALAQDELPSQEALEQDAREQQSLEQDAAIDRGEPNPSTATSLPPNSHATVEAPPELIGLISREPERFIGKTLVLAEGTQTKTVGPVLSVRKQLKDQNVYLIVDATGFFNSPTNYAVAANNLDRIEDGKLITPAAPGMHLLGQQYYPDDYEDLPKPVAPVPED
jgi:hypothetical protein